MTEFYVPGGVGEIYGLVRLEVPTSYRAWFGDLFRAFPDFEMEIVEIVAAGEKAAVRWRAERQLQRRYELRRPGAERRPASTSRAATSSPSAMAVSSTTTPT